MKITNSKHWLWVTSSNFAEGLPYAVINYIVVALYADLAMSNAAITLYTGLLTLPWTFKALWSPYVDIYRTKRWWMISLQAVLCLSFVGITLSLFSPHPLPLTLGLFFLIALCGSTYDIACDGFYMQVLTPSQQAYFVGVRTTAYRLSIIFTSGVLLYLSGFMRDILPTDSDPRSSVITGWSVVFAVLSALFLVLSLLHRQCLPMPHEALVRLSARTLLHEFLDTAISFFRKRDLLFLLLFLLAYRLGEALLSKVTILFLKDNMLHGGLGLTNSEYGIIYGTIGMIALMLGGILGGIYISRYGLRSSILPMALALNLPDLLYVWMATAQPSHLVLIGSFVAIEQFGYGFGLTAYTVYLLQSAKGDYATAHYALLTAIMAFGMNIPSLLSGLMQEHLGYTDFFVVTCLCTLPGIAASVWFWLKKKAVS